MNRHGARGEPVFIHFNAFPLLFFFAFNGYFVMVAVYGLSFEFIHRGGPEISTYSLSVAGYRDNAGLALF
ncbi:hypothetical protein ACLK1Y_13100 [Escherichia coli]